MRDKIIECLGTFENKVALNLVEISSEELDGYTRKLIEYNVSDTERVKSYLLVPNKEGKMPAILAIHQHHGEWHIGKSEVVGLTNNEMYSYGLDLVKRGFVVICPDIICFEDRMGPKEYKEDYDRQKAYERFKFCEYLVKGSSLQAKTLHDLSVAVDVLCSLDYVDSNRIGSIGHSLGGQETILIEWYDERIKVGASSCGISTLTDIINENILHNFYLYIPNLLKYCDYDEIIDEITQNKKLIMTTGLKDNRHCPLKGIEKIENKVKNDNFKLIRFNDEHKFNDEEKKIVYDYLESNL